MNLIINECWNIQKDKSDKWTNKDKLNALKLIKDAKPSRFEILMGGPVTLKAKQVCQKVKELTEENEDHQKIYFNLGPPPEGYGEL
jgi:hypothetical protein